MKKWFGTKTYFAKMVLFVSVSIILVVIVLSTVVYINAQNLLTKNEYEANQKIIYQVKYNIALMDESVINICKYLYVNNDVTSIMLSEHEDMMDVSIRLNKMLDSVMLSNPYIHSITVYNQRLNEAYTIGAPSFAQDPIISETLEEKSTVPILKPIIRNYNKVMNKTNEPERIFSYVMYDAATIQKKNSGIVIVNVKPEWLLKNVRQINMIDPSKGDKLFVMDGQGEFLDDQTLEPAMMKWAKESYTAFTSGRPQGDKEGDFEAVYRGKPYLITYAVADNAEMVLLKAQPEPEVHRYINTLRTNIVIISAVFLILSLLLSAGISHRIYRPLGSLISTIAKDNSRRNNGSMVADEITFLDYIYRQSMEKLDLFDKERYAYKDVMKHYWLNRLLTGNVLMDETELCRIFQEMRITIPPQGTYAVATLKLDNQKELRQSFSTKDRETIRFAVINISSEIVSRSYPNEGLDLKDDHVALIVSVPPDDDRFHKQLSSLLTEAQETVKQYFKLTFTASVSGLAEQPKQLPSLYNSAQKMAIYRFIFGRCTVLTPKQVEPNERNPQTGYRQQTEDRLLEAIRRRDVDDTAHSLNELFREIGTLSYGHALTSVFKLTHLLKEQIDYSSVSEQIMEKETLDDIYDLLINALGDISSGDAQTPHLYVVEAVKTYIEQNYAEPTICLTSIAELMKMPARRLSRLYKDATGMSIPDYVNEVRMTNAADLLVRLHLNVHEAAERVGITNETYFFSLFKKRYGTTPKEYAVRKIADRLVDSPPN